MPSMRTAGPGCCCCEDFLWGNEHSNYAINCGTITGTIKYTPGAYGEDTRNFLSQISTPTADAAAQHFIAPDWHNKRLYYAYSQWVRSGGGAITDTNSTFRWWDTTKTTASGATNNTTAVTVVTSAIVDALATNATTQKIYWAGRAHGAASPYLNGTTVDLRRMNYDGTDQRTLDTITVYRTGGIGLDAGIGAMLVNRTANQLIYTVKQNVTTSTANDYVWEIRSRDLATLTETTLYSVTSTLFLGSDLGDGVIKLLNCLSFDVAREKLYWCEHYTSLSGKIEGKVRRADLDGANVELLHQSADPYSVNFARFSNKLDKIVHSAKSRTATVFSAPEPGLFLRSPTDWNDATQIAADNYWNITPYWNPTSSFLWCGFETTGPGAKA